MTHDWNDDGTLLFEVKWLGYEDVSERTWEPEENLFVNFNFLTLLASVSN